MQSSLFMFFFHDKAQDFCPELARVRLARSKIDAQPTKFAFEWHKIGNPEKLA